MLGRGAETSRLDDRLAVPVVVLDGRLPRAQPDPHLGAAGLLATQACGGALNRDRTLHRVERTPEDDHQAVTGRLDLLAPASMDRLTQGAKMGSANGVAPIRAVVVQDRGRIDQIGEEHRHGGSSCSEIHGAVTPPRVDVGVRQGHLNPPVRSCPGMGRTWPRS